MSYDTLDLRDLADEARDLYDETMSGCGECSGEGYIEQSIGHGDDRLEGGVRVGDTINAYCPDCDGEGEYRSFDHCTDPDRLRSLLSLAAEVTNRRLPETDAELLDEADDLIDSLKDYGENEPVAIPEYGFESYAQDLAADLYGVGGPRDENNHWPYTCIDWEAAANELKQDYSSFSWEGTDYLIRSY